MNPLGAHHPAEPEEANCRQEADEVISSKTVTGDINPALIQLGVGVGRTHDIARDGDAEKYPHAEQRHPGEELDGSQLLHPCRHLPKRSPNFSEPLALFSAERLRIFGWIFARGYDGPQHRQKEDDRAYGERNYHCAGDRVRWVGGNADAVIVQYSWKFGCYDGTRANERRLHGEADGSLLIG